MEQWNALNKEAHYSLDTAAVEKLLQSLALKRYWVAEEAGVHKSTLRRWLSGEITKVRGENVDRLAGVLGARWTQLVREAAS